MKELDVVLEEMDFEFLGSGEHSMNIEGMRKALKNDHFMFLDIRSEEEVSYTTFPFAVSIPLHDLPKKYEELPKDKCIVVFCSSIFRAAVAYTYLRAKGFDEIKGLTVPIEDMVKAFKPGPLSKM